MTQILLPPPSARCDPPAVLWFDNEGLFSLSIPYRSEAFAEDLAAEPEAAPAARATAQRGLAFAVVAPFALALSGAAAWLLLGA